MHDRATFTRMEESTADDWRKIGAEFAPFARRLPDRVIDHMKVLDNPAFDPRAETLPIGEFEPILRRVFAAPKHSIHQAASPLDAATEATA